MHTPHSNNRQAAAENKNWRMKTGIICYRTGHLWDLVYVLYKLYRLIIVIPWNGTWTEVITRYCYAQDILYCNFDHIHG